MDPKIKNKIYEWLIRHPDHHYYDIENNDDPYPDNDVIYDYMLYPNNVCEYDDCVNRVMKNKYDENNPNQRQCQYIFRYGTQMSRCYAPCEDKYDRCEFHNHIIFEDIEKIVNDKIIERENEIKKH